MRLRFTIRDLLWLAVVVALAVGWWLDHRKQDHALAEANAKISRLEQFASYLKSVTRKPSGTSVKEWEQILRD
jgi:hypothetical protein